MKIDLDFLLRVLLNPPVLVSMGAALVLVLLFRFVAVGGLKKPKLALPKRVRKAPATKAKTGSDEGEPEDGDSGPPRKRGSRNLEEDEEAEAPQPPKKKKK